MNEKEINITKFHVFDVSMYPTKEQFKQLRKIFEECKPKLSSDIKSGCIIFFGTGGDIDNP